MDILIDNQKAIEVPAAVSRTEDGPQIFITERALDDILIAWMELDPARRAHETVKSPGGNAESIVIAWSNDNGMLHTRQVGSWSGSDAFEFNLHELQRALPEGMLRWGEDIGATDPLAGVL